MNTIVIYASKTGFAEKYARWIAEDLSADIFELSKITAETALAYDTIVFGGGLYAGGINGLRFLKRDFDRFAGKKLIVFATGATPDRRETTDELRDRNFTPEQQKRLGFFYLRGGFDFNRLRPADKVLMTLMKWKLGMKKEGERIADERGMLAAYEKPADFTRRKNIAALVEYSRS